MADFYTRLIPALLVGLAFLLWFAGPVPELPLPPAQSASAAPEEPLLWAVGEGGRMLLSKDDGQSWELSKAPASEWFLDVDFADGPVGWAVGRAGAAFHTVDGGRTWTPTASRVRPNLHRVRVAASGEVWAGAAEGALLYSADDGASWEWVRRGGDGVVRDIAFQGSTAWAAGDHGMILRSGDGGRSWRRLNRNAVPTLVNLSGIDFLDADRGFAWGDFGTLLATRDGGERWKVVPIGESGPIRGLFLAADTHALALTSDTILVLNVSTPHPAVFERFDWEGGTIRRGQLLPDGSLLVWGNRGDTAQVRWTATVVPAAAPPEPPAAEPPAEPAPPMAEEPAEPAPPVEWRLAVDRSPPEVKEPTVAAESLAIAFLEQAGRFLGRDYELDPLGEGPHGLVDQDPRLWTESFDCVTLIEHALAFSVAGPEKEPLPTLDRIRYMRGRALFEERNHFFVADWIPQNSWLVEDVTSSVGGFRSHLLTRRIGRRSFFRGRGLADAGFEDTVLSTYVVPRPEVSATIDRLEDGMIVVLIGREDWLFASHTGIVRLGSAGPLIRHASSRGEVLDQDLLRYLAGRGESIVGVKFLRVVG